ncbi:MAG: hypothetical protein MNPFHGCM_00265 [Gemmatimonadaceae bacterium]|nr:hypothetical protein [Gemmatimonadaceae bacterium]
MGAAMSDEIRGPLQLSGIQMPTWILRYNADGICESPLTRGDLLERLRAEEHSDVILFSHGWNNDFDAASRLYGRFLAAFEGLLPSHPANRTFTPVFVGITWPSTWLVFDNGPKIAGEESLEGKRTEASIDVMSRAIAEAGTPDKAARFRELMGKPTVTAEESEELSRLMLPLLASASDDEIGDGARDLTASDLASAAEATALVEHSSTAPADLDDFGGTGDGGATAGPKAAGALSFLDPRTYLRLASVWQMKDRAGRVGARAMSALMRDIQTATSARIHAVGHSYGCKVMLSGICAGPAFVRPLDSLLLLQPACSYLCFAASVPGTRRAGGYRRALDPSMVRHPIFSTYSRKDLPLHATFHLSLRRDSDAGEPLIAASATSAGDPPSRYAALGGYGPRGAGEELRDPIPAAGEDYGSLGTASIIGLDGSKGRISGHGDIAKPETAWALHRLVFRK